MPLQLALMAARCGANDGPAGWKLGLGAPAALQALGTTGPLVSFLPAAGSRDQSALPDPARWANPLLEPELAVRIRSRVGAEASPDEALAAIAEIMPAFELIDVDRPIEQFEEGLAEGLYHMGFVLGVGVPLEQSVPAPTYAIVTRDGAPAANLDVPDAVGLCADLLLHTVRYLAAFGASVGPGEILMTGSLTDPFPLCNDQRWKLEVAGLGTVELTTATAP
jgi:2-keto-4-pentenoate hydratase